MCLGDEQEEREHATSKTHWQFLVIDVTRAMGNMHCPLPPPTSFSMHQKESERKNQLNYIQVLG
jgi:hypothetical protein